MPTRSKAPSRSQLRLAFSETIKILRKKAKISQEDLAIMCGVDRAYMSALERAQHTPTIETVYKLLPKLDVSFRHFAITFEASLRGQGSRRGL